MIKSNYSFGQGPEVEFVHIDKPVRHELDKAITADPTNVEHVVGKVLFEASFCKNEKSRTVIVRKKGNHKKAFEPGMLRINLISEVCLEILANFIAKDDSNFRKHRALMTAIPAPREHSAKPKAAHRS